MIRLYVIIRADGSIKLGARGQLAVYRQYRRATLWATDDGDSVVPADIDLTKEPLFIRKKAV